MFDPVVISEVLTCVVMGDLFWSYRVWGYVAKRDVASCMRTVISYCCCCDLFVYFVLE